MKNVAGPEVVRTRRQAQAADTRTVIVAAAAELFLRDGYVGTSMDSIAAQAGVAIQTLYNSVGNKPALLSAVLDAAVSGPSTGLSVAQFMEERMAATTDLHGAAAVMADWFAEGLPRSRATFTAISQAAAVDPAVAKLRDERAMQRLANYRRAAAVFRLHGGLSSGLDDEGAAAVIFAVGHPDNYASLVDGAGWNLQRYRHWVYTALVNALR